MSVTKASDKMLGSKPHSPDLKDALATYASGCGHLASSLVRPPPMHEIMDSRPASEQPRETRFIYIYIYIYIYI